MLNLDCSAFFCEANGGDRLSVLLVPGVVCLESGLG